MLARPLRSRRPAAVLGIALVAAACGGAIDNGDLFQKEQGTSSGGTTSPSPTGSAPSSPPGTPVPQPTPPNGRPCTVSFKKDVLDVLSAGGCASAQCHGGPSFRNRPNIDPAQSLFTYKNLRAYEIEGVPYVAIGSTDPDDSSITCNLRGACGTRMPLGDKLSSTQLDVIGKWLSCGAPFN